MTTTMRRLRTVGLLAALGGGALAWGAQQAPPERRTATKADAEQWMATASTWGRWGQDDQLGSLNYITNAKRRAAAALVRTGEVVSMERPIVLEDRHEDIKRDGRPNGLPFYEMTFRTFPKGDPRGNEDFTSDVQSFAPHGALLTHLDALCHYSDGKGRLYNGYVLSETVTAQQGCGKLGLDTLKQRGSARHTGPARRRTRKISKRGRSRPT